MMRLGEWWSSRIGPLLGVGYVFIALADLDAGRAYRCLIAMLISATLLAAYAYIVNDSCDVYVDRLAGKPNSMAGIKPVGRAGLAVLCAVAGSAPWALVDPGGGAGWLCLGGIVVLPLLYSVPPARLKGRGVLGLVSDALNVHTLPVLFVAALFLHGATPSHRIALGFAAALAAWSLGLGLRSITRHQLLDRDLDERAGIPTFVVRVSPARAQLIARRVFFPIEVAALAAMWILLGLRWPWVLVVGVAYLLLYRAVWNPSRRSISAAAVPSAAEDYVVLVEFYQLWPALLAAGCATAVDSAFGWLILAHLALFVPTVRKQSADLWHLVLRAATRRQVAPLGEALNPPLPARRAARPRTAGARRPRLRRQT